MEQSQDEAYYICDRFENRSKKKEEKIKQKKSWQ